jgi:hypothetical protein
MEEPYGEGVATHPGPKPCGGGREAAAEALVGAHAGEILSSENTNSGAPTGWSAWEGNTSGGDMRATGGATESLTLCMRGTSMLENREIPLPPWTGRSMLLRHADHGGTRNPPHNRKGEGRSLPTYSPRGSRAEPGVRIGKAKAVIR